MTYNKDDEDYGYTSHLTIEQEGKIVQEAYGVSLHLNAIIVWPFHDAPEALQSLSHSHNGGDEDWLALVPPILKDRYVGWLESDRFGCCNVDKIKLKNDYIVYIGCHA